jgi:glycosyltransferase involved in cell wall biosynthesis
MAVRRAALAVPGDLDTLTGGYLYDRRLLVGLRNLGREVMHIELPETFPDPSPADRAVAAARIAAVAPDCPLVIDGLAFGAMAREDLCAVQAPIVALVHHPLAEERGLDAAQRSRLYRSERDNLALAAHVVVTSGHTLELLTERYGVAAERVTIARPGIDGAGSRDLPARSPTEGPPLILSVGILVPRKGHDTLLQALARIADRPWRAVIVGAPRDTRFSRQLEDLVDDLDLASRVHLAGRVPEGELAGLWRQASVFALATRYEGHGIVFDEAMRHGLPIVTCAAGAVPDTVAPGAGLLTASDDPGAFAAALASVLDDADTRTSLARASAAAGAALPGWDSTARCVARVLDGIATRG